MSSAFFAALEHQPFRLPAADAGALLIHGFPGTPAEMRPLGEALREASWTAWAPLLPGMGPQIVEHTLQRRKEWLRETRQHWSELLGSVENNALIGYSLGGALALQLAAEQPPDQLVLIAPLARIADWRARLLPIVRLFIRRIKPFKKADFRDPGVRAMFGGMLDGLDLDDPQVQAQLRSQVVLHTATLDELRKTAASGRRAAKRVRCPTLIIQGRDDQVVRPHLTRRLARRLQGQVELHEIRGGHELVHPHSPQREQVTRIIVDFLKDR